MSILSYPDRGPWGSSKWRGNCSGHVYAELFNRLQPGHFVDPMCGSGTSIDVAREMKIEAVGLDLHSGFNIVRDSIMEAVGRETDLCVSHPPYGAMIVYSGEVWGQAHPDDLSRCVDDEEFHRKMQLALLNQREATKPGGYYGTIIGDWRRNGQYTSYQAEMIARMPKDELAAVIIKAQHNVMSGQKQYGRMKLPFIMHEYILLWQRPEKVMSFLNTLQQLATEQQARLTGTWVTVVRAAMMMLDGHAPLSKLYEVIADKAPEKLRSNPHWQAKVRQVLQQHPSWFEPVNRGTWKLSA